jgi:hypothetical protein
MEGWRTSYWFEEAASSIVLKFYRQPIQFVDFEVKGLETRLGKAEYLKKDETFKLSKTVSLRSPTKEKRSQFCELVFWRIFIIENLDKI